MQTIRNTGQLPDHLATFIWETCPWMNDGFEVGYIFVLDDGDIGTTTINLLPEVELDLATFDFWEGQVIQDSVTGYWNVVAILGQEFGCTLFMFAGFVESIPELQRRLEEIRQ